MIDIASALTASFFVAPFITVIDRSIIENASGKRVLKEGIKAGFSELFTKPHKFYVRREFRLIWTVYGGTYISANATDSVCKKIGISP